MGIYLSMRILDGYLDYSIVTKKAFVKYKEEVDRILTLEGREDLIQGDDK